MIKILLSFYIGLRVKYQEQSWFKKVFYKHDGVLAAVFTERQQHVIASHHLRSLVHVGEYTEVPLTKASHFLFLVSLVTAFFVSFVAENSQIRNCFTIDIICFGVLLFEFLIVAVSRSISLIFAHVPALVPLFYSIKRFEAYLHKTLCRRRVTIVKVEKQPYIEGGWIRCGDPHCHMMHKK